MKAGERQRQRGFFIDGEAWVEATQPQVLQLRQGLQRVFHHAGDELCAVVAAVEGQGAQAGEARRPGAARELVAPHRQLQLAQAALKTAARERPPQCDGGLAPVADLKVLYIQLQPQLLQAATVPPQPLAEGAQAWQAQGAAE